MFIFTRFHTGIEFILMPIYIVFPKDTFEMFVYSSYSAMEQAVLNRAKTLGAWCTIIQYDGTDELIPKLEYHIHSNLLVRTNVGDSLSNS